MLRGLSHLAAAASLLLFIATVALWVRGRQRMDHFWLIHGDDGSELVRSDRGRITVRHTRPNGRSRITLPRRVSHWACEVGSQLPPKRSPNHWQWRFLTYEGVGAATRGEVAAAKTAKQQAEATLMQSRGALRRPIDQRDPVAMAAYTQQLWAARRAEQVVENADQVLHGSNYWEWTFPAWLAAAVTAAPPALWVIGRLRRRRALRQGRCPDCGYDLRASGERCPECGRPTRAGNARSRRPTGG